MTTTDTDHAPRVAMTANALHTVAMAGKGLAAAKRTKSVALVARARRELQDAVDAARALGVEWGQIGSALGIARGNAYQRYRTQRCR